jgi:hypothetical protein
MTSFATTIKICDARACPAPAKRALMFHGQDFYFCGHHAVEIESALAVAVSESDDLIAAVGLPGDGFVTALSRQDVAPAGAYR